MVVSPCSPRDSQETSPTPQSEGIISPVLSFLHGPALISAHDYWKNHSFDYTELCQQSMSLLSDRLSRFVTDFLSRSNSLLISWLQSPSAVILEPPKLKFVTVSPSIYHEVMGPDAMMLPYLDAILYLQLML